MFANSATRREHRVSIIHNLWPYLLAVSGDTRLSGQCACTWHGKSTSIRLMCHAILFLLTSSDGYLVELSFIVCHTICNSRIINMHKVRIIIFMPKLASLNSRNELISSCRHRSKYLLCTQPNQD